MLRVCPVVPVGDPGSAAQRIFLFTLIPCVPRFILVAPFGFSEETAFRETFGMGHELIYFILQSYAAKRYIREALRVFLKQRSREAGKICHLKNYCHRCSLLKGGKEGHSINQYKQFFLPPYHSRKKQKNVSNKRPLARLPLTFKNTFSLSVFHSFILSFTCSRNLSLFLLFLSYRFWVEKGSTSKKDSTFLPETKANTHNKRLCIAFQ